MPLSLHAALVPSWLQLLNSGKGWLDKAADCGIAEADLIDARLVEDMMAFTYQVKAMAIHSQGAVEAVREGVFSPDFSAPPITSFAGLREKLDGAIAFLQGLSEDDMEEMIGQPMRFEIGPKRLDFTAENFLLSFSQPNFYFHATTAYGILRMKGVEIGKIDYLGGLRIKQG